VGAALGVALVLTSCGGGEQRRAAPQPKIPHQLAEQLAEHSDQVADAFAAGDSCRALEEARHLQRDAIKAINGGRIPARFQEHLAATVSDLAARIECVSPDDVDERDKPGKRKGHEKRGKDD
jgi:hypothetical protein